MLPTRQESRHTCVLQIAACSLSAAATAAGFFLWRRLNQENRKKLWRFYGVFSGFGCIGSCFGILANAAKFHYHEALFVELDDTQALTVALNNSSYSYALLLSDLEKAYSNQAHMFLMSSVLLIPEAIQIFFASVAKLMVLDRITHVAFSTSRGMPARWAIAERVVIGAVVLLNAIACCISVASTFYSAQRITLSRKAAAAFAANQTEIAFQHNSDIISLSSQLYQVQSVTDACQAAALLFIVATFVLVFAVCARRIAHILRQPRADAATLMPNLNTDILRVRRQIVGVVAFVFVAFLLMAFALTLAAVSEYGANTCLEPVPTPYCDPCYNTYALVQQWIFFTPEVDILSKLISHPLALLVALWGMTSNRMLQMLKQQGRKADSKKLEWLK
jgi:hypothetical protein